MSIRCVAWLPSPELWLAVTLAGLGSVGCSDASHRLGGVDAAATGDAQHLRLCSEGAELEILDQMEDGNDTIEMLERRGGNWIAINDETTAGQQTPPSGVDTFEMSELVPPRAGSHFAARTHGGGFTVWGAGIGFELYNKLPYDLSRYAGITFWARRGPDTTGTLRFGMPDAATSPRGGQCRQRDDELRCNDYFGADLSLDATFRRYSFEWQELTQVGFGEPKPDFIDTSRVYGVRFQVAKNQDFDFWIDDIALLCQPR